LRKSYPDSYLNFGATLFTSYSSYRHSAIHKHDTAKWQIDTCLPPHLGPVATYIPLAIFEIISAVPLKTVEACDVSLNK